MFPDFTCSIVLDKMCRLGQLLPTKAMPQIVEETNGLSFPREGLLSGRKVAQRLRRIISSCPIELTYLRQRPIGQTISTQLATADSEFVGFPSGTMAETTNN